MEIMLEAKNDYEKAIFDYLKENANEALKTKINNGKKTLSQCMDYVKKEAKNQAVGGMAMIEDKIVYGWAVHFFEEDSIKAKAAHTAEIKKPENKIVKFERKEEPKKEKPKTVDDGQMNLFDFLGGSSNE